MSSLPGDTREEAGLVGESGVQDAGTRESTSMFDRLKLVLTWQLANCGRSLVRATISTSRSPTKREENDEHLA